MEDFKKWFEQARHDLKIAEYNFKGNFLDSCVFYCQQTIEKLLKALLIKKEMKLIKTHDLVLLGRKINLPDNFFKKLGDLNGAYTESRYGISLGKIPAELFNKEEVSELLNLAKEILEWAENQI